ncbi:clasp N terminal-domain-containing protein [Russula dissimulans]|nr:clasp N terminal-domain-containing protein [Russula dissimulans]
MAPKAKIPEELERARASLSLTETEETWDAIGNTLLRIIALSKGGACEFPTALSSSIRSIYRPITSAAASERSRLSATAVECIAALATGLGPSFDPLVPLFIPTLLSLCSRPNKVFISRAKAAIQTIIDQTQLISLLPYFVGALGDKSVTLRLIAVESLLSCVLSFNPPDLEKDARARDVENAIRLTATDASADVRKVSRHVFDAYKILLPARVESFAAPLSPTTKKYLNIDIPSGNSRPQSSQSTHTIPATRPTSSLESAPPRRAECHPRPATSMAYHRSISSSALASAKSSTTIAARLIRSETEPIIAPPNGQTATRTMPPPAIVPQRHQQVPQGPLVSTRRAEPKVAERPPDTSSLRTTTQILRPASTQISAPSLKQNADPLRAGAMSIKEKFLGGAQRVLLPPAPPKPSLARQEKKVSPDVQAIPRRSRLDSVRHGPKSSIAMDAKRAVSEVVARSSAVPKRLGLSHPSQLVGKKEVPIPAAEKDDLKPELDGKGRGVGSKTPDVREEGKREARNGPSAHDQQSSISTRPLDGKGQGIKTKKGDDPKGIRPMVDRTSQSVKRAATTQTHPPNKVMVRTGGPTQPTLSQLARMKATDEEKERRAAAKGPTKRLTIRPKNKVVHPKATSEDAEIPAAAMTTPLPPSPEVRPEDVPLPGSPVSVPLVARTQDGDEQDAESSTIHTENKAVETKEHSPMPVPVQLHPASLRMVTAEKTPISTLVRSIQRGFLLSPNSPLSPAQPDAEWECPAWPGLALNVGEEPSFEGVAESTMKQPLAAAGTDPERRALIEMN